ncbi:DUF2188 domain-containing protein [Alkalibacillus salilacus]|uniref:Uncharacterized protein YdaT n=1 Tax=Alkalibacillus salilacus TaxID=284582 RepID=A0ABT9VIB7_9BACI|nr:DUF2188 domain-containing protein [Alkalibacillus salilacus]MDQ0160718.1 uncharacterized protein YdaT [Alkalibacillus salilacus]
MSHQNNIHVLPHDDGWQVKRAGNTRASKITQTQQEAINYGEDLAKNYKSELIIHGKDGRIRERRSYGNDPYPPRG